MSQSILQNGYAILLANTSDLDLQLQARDQLLNRLVQTREQKIRERDDAIASRREQIEKLEGYILSLDPSKTDELQHAIDIKRRLLLQIDIIQTKNINATYDDIRESHAFFVNTTFKPLVPVAYGYSTVGVTPLPLFGSSTQLKIPIYGDFITDQALHIRLSELKTVHKDNRVRWFDFIGHRIIKEIRLVMDGIVLDRYGCEEMEMYYRFYVSANQKPGWMRCVGQETPILGTLIQDPLKQTARERKFILDGLQSPKQSHAETDLFIPLLFWYNLDPAFALSNWNITYEKFYIEVEFASVENCVSVIDFAEDGGLYERPSILACNLVTNHVYTIPEVAELFKHRMQFSIIRVHKRVERILNKSFDSVNIGDIKHAVESLHFRFRPTENETNENRAETWRMNGVITYNEINYASIITSGSATSLAYTPAYYYSSTPAISAVSLESNGSTIYEGRDGVFYNAYLPLRFGGDEIMTPTDDGAYLMTFGIYPGDSQPSGYLNFSNSRNQFISYRSSYIKNQTPVNFVICAKCINFLVMDEGSLSLRYLN